MTVIDNYNNIEPKTSVGSLNIDYLEQPVRRTATDSNQDLHYLYTQAPTGIILTIIAALLVTWFILPVVPDYIYIPWLTFIVLTAFTHTFIINQFSKQKSNLQVNNQWAIYQTFMVGITGFAFSIGYLLFLPLLSPFNQIILLLILATLAVSFLPILSAFLPAYIIYISAFIFPMVFWIYNLSPEKAYPIAVLLAVTYCMLVVIASYYSKILMEAFGLAREVNGQIKTLYDIIDKTKTLNVKLKKDIYEYIKKNNSVSKEKQQAEITLQSIGEGVISTDQNGRIKYINPIAEIYTGWEAKDVKGMYLSTILTLVDESTHIALPNPVTECLEKNIPINSKDGCILVRRDGLEYAIEYSTTPINENNIAAGTVMIFRDVTEKRNMQKTLDWQAKHDPLTGLINRREFEERLNKLISNPRESGREHALCFIDLDRFKLINDSCGHLAGDQLLIKISDRLRKIARDTDTIARLGGDEFAVLLYSCNTGKAKLIAEIFQEEAFNSKFDWYGKHFSVAASIGIVPLNESTTSLTELQRTADLVCYRAKDAGGNRIEVYEEGQIEQTEKHTGELKILEDLQHNLEKEKFTIFTQRIKPLDSLNDILFHEVLLRMHNSEGQLLNASHFMHTAKMYHLLSAIDNWVLKVVMELISYGSPLFNKAHLISINLSQQSICDEKFIKHIINLFDEYNIPTGNICFELNQCQFDGSTQAFKRFVTLLKKQGCKVALDDFNYNPSNINLIKQLGVDFIKIDAREFGDINDSKNYNYQLLESINGINHLTGAQTIIKCIDNENIIEHLHEIGTDYIQGYSVEAPQAVNNS
ncbi:MAG: diguanylate cyclase domain-containing protein [Gammaproteobacteria bacterium]